MFNNDEIDEVLFLRFEQHRQLNIEQGGVTLQQC